MSDVDLSKEIEMVSQLYPKLKIIYSEEKLIKLEGDLDITDIEDNYLETFKISILLPPKFPFAVPEVREKSNIIPRIIDRHISPNGVCCLDIDHELLFLAASGIQLSQFIRQKVYPFFANQVYYIAFGLFAGEEYAHYDKGVIQFYYEKLNFPSASSVDKILSILLKYNKLPKGDFQCFCGSSKLYKDCHQKAVDFLKKMPISRLKKDLKLFKSIT